MQNHLNSETFIESIKQLYSNRGAFVQKMSEAKVSNGVEEIISLIKEYSK